MCFLIHDFTNFMNNYAYFPGVHPSVQGMKSISYSFCVFRNIRKTRAI